MSIAKKCLIDNEYCTVSPMAMGYCKRHYDSNRRWGNPTRVDTREEESSRPLCKVEDCDKKNSHTGYCSMHYSRLLRYGRLNTTRQMKGQFAHPLYSHWRAMLSRCYNKNSSSYHNYGGRGIRVYKAWRDNAWTFYEYMGDKPSPDHTLDRIDVDGNYEPGNVRWADAYIQARNKRVNSLNSYGHAGVGFDENRAKYCASLTFMGKKVLNARYATLEEAIRARKDAELKYWGSKNPS